MGRWWQWKYLNRYFVDKMSGFWNNADGECETRVNITKYRFNLSLRLSPNSHHAWKCSREVQPPLVTGVLQAGSDWAPGAGRPGVLWLRSLVLSITAPTQRFISTDHWEKQSYLTYIFGPLFPSIVLILVLGLIDPTRLGWRIKSEQRQL